LPTQAACALDQAQRVAVRRYLNPQTIDQRSVFAPRARRFESVDDGSGAAQLVVARRQRGIQRLSVLGAHQRLAPVTEATRVARLTHSTFGVAERVGSVDWLDGRCPALQYEATPRVVQLQGVGLAFRAQIGG
jgi:hypothetical protein